MYLTNIDAQLILILIVHKFHGPTAQYNEIMREMVLLQLVFGRYWSRCLRSVTIIREISNIYKGHLVKLNFPRKARHFNVLGYENKSCLKRNVCHFSFFSYSVLGIHVQQKNAVFVLITILKY